MLFCFALNTSTYLYTEWIAWFNKNLLTGRTLCFFSHSAFLLYLKWPCEVSLFRKMVAKNRWVEHLRFISVQRMTRLIRKVESVTVRGMTYSSHQHFSPVIQPVCRLNANQSWRQLHISKPLFASHIFFLCRFYVPMQIECLNIFTRN